MDVNTQNQLVCLVEDALGDDPRKALIAYRKLTAEQLPWIEQRVVMLARQQDWNWARIGRLLGRSRSALLQRFSQCQMLPRPDPEAAQREFERELLRRVGR